MAFAAGMAWRSDRLVITVERMAAALDTHFFFGAAFNCDRRFRTGLPVDSDLSLITGSSAVPTLTMLPPLGPLIAALAPPIAVTVPNVRLP